MTESINSSIGITDPSLIAGNLTATQELSMQRMELLHDASQELAADLPDYLGMTLFGSTARGEARPESDVDIFVFIEANPESPAQQSLWAWGKGKELETAMDGTAGTVSFAGYMDVHGKQITKHIRAKGIEKVGLIQLPLSKEIVDQAADALLVNAEVFTKTGIPQPVPRNIRALFHVPIDSLALQPYLRRVIDRLKSDPRGEDAWSCIRQMVNGFERGRETGDLRVVTHRYIPETLKEAQPYYLSSTE